MTSPEEIAQAAAKATSGLDQLPPQADEAPAAAQATPEITHKEPILASGAAGPVVKRLVDLLAVCGHDSNTIIAGENPGNVFDNTVMSDVKAFRAAQNIQEDPSLDIAGDFVGPATWQALYDTTEKELGL